MAKKKSGRRMMPGIYFLKYVAMGIFILMPFLGFYLGMRYEQRYTPSAPVSILNPTPTPDVVDRLEVSRSISPLFLDTHNPMIPFKTITDAMTVQKLYNAILALPRYSTASIEGHCVLNPNKVLYDLNFYRNDKLIQHGMLSTTPCGGANYVELDGRYKRAYDANFEALLESSFHINGNQLHGK